MGFPVASNEASISASSVSGGGAWFEAIWPPNVNPWKGDGELKAGGLNAGGTNAVGPGTVRLTGVGCFVARHFSLTLAIFHAISHPNVAAVSLDNSSSS